MRKLLLTMLTLGLLGGLEGCSSVGPGFANHPIDCAFGIPWADCLPNSLGYEHGGGQIHRQEQAKKENDIIKSKIEALREEFNKAVSAPEFDKIRPKVSLENVSFADTNPPEFRYLTNNTFPTLNDLPAIASWAELRDKYIADSQKTIHPPEHLTNIQRSNYQYTIEVFTKAQGQISTLIIALWQRKLTYGEFAQKRYETIVDARTVNEQFIHALLEQDQVIAERNFQARLAAWASYNQALAMRQPQTIIMQQQTVIH